LEVKDFLVRLSETPRVSGRESAGAEAVTEAFSEYLSDVRTDKLGNVVGIKKGNGKGKLMLAAHMDEIGLMVSGIDEKGFVGFVTIGGVDFRVLPAQEVWIHGSKKVFGVIGHKPPHLTSPEDRKKPIKIEDLKIDTGYSPEKISTLVRVGDIITVNAKTHQLKNNKLAGRSLDDAAGVAALYSAMKRLRDVKHDLDIYFIATSQEEIGGNGGIISAYGIEPDLAIAVDVGFAKTPELDDEKTIEMGKGPSIGIGPGIHPKMFELLKKSAKDAGIKHQIEVYPSWTGTDADDIQISRKGVAMGVLSIPLKYMHTPVETVLPDDIEETGRLIAEFIRAFNDTELEEALDLC